MLLLLVVAVVFLGLLVAEAKAKVQQDMEHSKVINLSKQELREKGAGMVFSHPQELLDAIENKKDNFEVIDIMDRSFLFRVAFQLTTRSKFD
jgi:hypothetical protein